MQSTKWVHEALWVSKVKVIQWPCPNLSDLIFLNFFSSVTTRPIEVKFHVEPPWDWGTNICSNCPGHMTKMATMPIYGKTFKNLLLWNRTLMTLKLGMQHRVIEYYQVCSNDAPGLTLTYFMARSTFVLYAFLQEKVKTRASAWRGMNTPGWCHFLIYKNNLSLTMI